MGRGFAVPQTASDWRTERGLKERSGEYQRLNNCCSDANMRI